jgi:hypothetical protein
MAHRDTRQIRIGPRQTLSLVWPYVRDRLLAQVRSVWLIIAYLVFFQTVVLKIRIFEASVIGAGIGLVIAGLAFFMEGLFLGLMRLGALVGEGLPRKSPLPVVVAFGLVLGFLATLAEPSIQVLQMAGRSVRPWEAPLLFLLLNTHAQDLVYAVGAGVGAAVGLGMLRFYYSLSLKPLIYLLVGGLVLATVWAGRDPNLEKILGLAWDCGAVTTGPVTVPLVLALGIGVSRMVGSAESGTMGFGVVTLASLLPVAAVLALGFGFNPGVPAPMNEEAFFRIEHRARIAPLFENQAAMTRYVLTQAGPRARLAFFGDDPKALAEHLQAHDPGEAPASETQIEADMDLKDLLARHFAAALKAIGLLTLPLLGALWLLVRERLPYPDEILLGLAFCILGLAVFSIGIELGLDKLGTQVGGKLPVTFKAVPIAEERRTIRHFDPDLVHQAIGEDGEKRSFFFIAKEDRVAAVPYDPTAFDPQTGQYRHTPIRGPLFGGPSPLPGLLVLVLFAFVMGYGATLAEPALNALGVTVEEVTAGAFKKASLMQAVAVGVGAGIALGVAKIVLAIPLAWILAPSYLLLLGVTGLSSEEFVNIGWDSAGVTTGPITVPLVLAMGLGIGSQVGVVEGFGILAAASVCPILTVLLMGLHVQRKRRAALGEAAGQGHADTRTAS